MFIKANLTMAAVALALGCGVASATTVTASFTGNTGFGDGEFLGTAGTAQEVTIVGDPFATGTPVSSVPEFVEVGSGSAQIYTLTSLTYALPDLGRSFTANDVDAYVINDGMRGFDTVDAVYIRGRDVGAMPDFLLEYFIAFPSDTVDTSSLSLSLTQGIASRTDWLVQIAGVEFVENDDFSAAFGQVTLIDFRVDEDPTDVTPPGGGGGGGGGGIADDAAVIPLPASLPLLLVGLGALAAARRRRR